MKAKKLKGPMITIVSAISFVVVAVLLFYGKFKASALLRPILDKLPKDEAGLVKITEDVLGSTVEKIKKGDMTRKVVQEGEKVFEESDYLEPAREVRDDLESKIQDVVEGAKELPAKELKHFQLEVCKRWLGEDMIATGIGESD